MERMTHWRAEPTRSGRVHRRNSRGRRLRAAAATGAMVAVTIPALSADGAVGGTRSIEVFTGPDVVMLAGYPPNTNVKVEVVRHGFVVGYTTRLTDSIGGVEINHVGGGAGDCFTSPTTPDLQPSDTIRTRVLKPGGDRDTSVVRGVWIDDVQFGSTTITVSGHVALTGPEAVDPATDILDLRINKDLAWEVNDRPGRSDRRVEIGADVQPDGRFSHVVTASAADVADARDNADTFLEWSTAAASELTVAEFGVPEAIEGCPPPAAGPSAPLLPSTQDSGKVGDHVTNQATDLSFSGLAGTGVVGAPGPGETVTLRVDGSKAGEVTADDNGVYRFTGVALPARATPHTVSVVVTRTGFAERLVTVDTRKPVVFMRSLGPNPLPLTGADRLRAVYGIGERATVQARIVHFDSTNTVRILPQRTIAVAGPATFTWNGKNVAGLDVRPGRYQLVLQATDTAGNITTQRNAFRVTR